jgi:hypothetical protein
MKLILIRYLFLLDAAVLFLLGLLLMFAPAQIERVFQFNDLPPAVGYLIGMWGCVVITLAVGYIVAATDPLRHAAFAQIGIARGALECLFGTVCVARGVVSFHQAGVGIIVAALVAIAYIALYPKAPAGPAPAPST